VTDCAHVVTAATVSVAVRLVHSALGSLVSGRNFWDANNDIIKIDSVWLALALAAVLRPLLGMA